MRTVVKKSWFSLRVLCAVTLWLIISCILRQRLVVAQADEDLITLDFHFMGSGRLCGRHGEGRAGADVEFRPVTRTGDGPCRRIERTLAQRTAIVCANVV